MATIRHVARWLHQQRPLLAGDPLAQVKDLQTDAPDWNGLERIDVKTINALKIGLRATDKGLYPKKSESIDGNGTILYLIRDGSS